MLWSVYQNGNPLYIGHSEEAAYSAFHAADNHSSVFIAVDGRVIEERCPVAGRKVHSTTLPSDPINVVGHLTSKQRQELYQRASEVDEVSGGDE